MLVRTEDLSLRHLTAASLAQSAAAEHTRSRACRWNYINPRKVLLYESTRKEFREAIEGGALKAVIVPTGSTEQHNEHLAMINDTASVTLIAQQAALLLYPKRYGCDAGSCRNLAALDGPEGNAHS